MLEYFEGGYKNSTWTLLVGQSILHLVGIAFRFVISKQLPSPATYCLIVIPAVQDAWSTSRPRFFMRGLLNLVHPASFLDELQVHRQEPVGAPDCFLNSRTKKRVYP